MRVLSLALGASFLFLTRASEIFAVSNVAMHDVHGLRRRDVAGFLGVEQLEQSRWCLADRVEVRFRSFKGDQFRKGAVVTRAHRGPPRLVPNGGGAVGLIIELQLPLTGVNLPSLLVLRWLTLMSVAAVGPYGPSIKSCRRPAASRGVGGIAANGVCVAFFPSYWGRYVLGRWGGVARAVACRR